MKSVRISAETQKQTNYKQRKITYIYKEKREKKKKKKEEEEKKEGQETNGSHRCMISAESFRWCDSVA